MLTPVKLWGLTVGERNPIEHLLVMAIAGTHTPSSMEPGLASLVRIWRAYRDGQPTLTLNPQLMIARRATGAQIR